MLAMSETAPKIFFLAGEHSGDVLGAGLLRSLKELGVTEFSGIGGPLMREQGLKSLVPMDELCVMGLLEVLWQLPRLLKLIDAVVEEIEKFNPDVLVTIDLPDFNFQVAKRLKKRGNCNARIVHYVAPSVWAWRPGRAKKVAAFLDGLICLFPNEPPYFTKHHLRAEFVGHPLIEHDPQENNGAGFRQKFSIPPDAPVLGVFFGSRVREIEEHAEILVDTVNVIIEQYPDLNLIIPTVPELEYEVRKVASTIKNPAFVLLNPDDKWDEFAACNVAVAVSGTVGLELAYMGVPHVVIYKMHPVSWILVKLLVKSKYAHIANILMDEPVIPEYLQKKADVLEISKGILKLFKDENERTAQLLRCKKIPGLLTASPGQSPSRKAAEFVMEIAKSPAKKILPKKPALPKPASFQYDALIASARNRGEELIEKIKRSLKKSR
jgi:lipid-A-disaccharide synthase